MLRFTASDFDSAVFLEEVERTHATTPNYLMNLTEAPRFLAWANEPINHLALESARRTAVPRYMSDKHITIARGKMNVATRRYHGTPNIIQAAGGCRSYLATPGNDDLLACHLCPADTACATQALTPQAKCGKYTLRGNVYSAAL